MCAWRKPCDGGCTETTTDIGVRKGSRSTSPVVAKFADGWECELTDFTVQVWLEHQASKAKGPVLIVAPPTKLGEPAAAQHEGSATKGDEEVSVKPRKDRKPLMSLFIGKSQKCSVKVDDVGGPELSFNLMKQIGEAYVRGDIDVAGMYDLRDRVMEAGGCVAPVRKRPASSSTPSVQASSSSSQGPMPVVAQVSQAAPLTPPTKQRKVQHMHAIFFEDLPDSMLEEIDREFL